MTAERTAVAGTPPGDMLPAGLMRLVADGLKAHGLGVRLPAREDGCRISVERWGGHCDVSVSDFGLVGWECFPWAGHEADPKLTAGAAAFLLTGRDEDCPCQGSAHDRRGMSFKGIVGNELRARGFDVGLEAYEDSDLFEVAAEIVVTNPVIHPNANVRISDDGAIAWECDYPYEATAITDTPEYFAVLASPGELAESIVATAARAISLLPGMPAGDANVQAGDGEADSAC
jgi:hypothetical protein